MRSIISSSLAALLLLTSCNSDKSVVPAGPAGDGCVCLNDIQVIGSHNSYKQAVEQPILDFLDQLDPSLSPALEYEHIPVIDQLNLGLRSLEFDVYHDPEGGRYSNPRGLGIVQDAGATPLPYDEAGDLIIPGLKMFHIQDVDFRSHHLLFVNGLAALKAWSDDHDGHLPIVVLINAKDDLIPLTVSPLPFTTTALATIDAEIRTIFSPEDLITPDDVRGSFESLEQAVLTAGWPELVDVSGKILFVLDENSSKTNLYLESFPGLQGAAMFVDREEGNPEAAFRIVNDPVADFEKIQSLVNQGYMVRTRADSETVEARANDRSRFERAIASGAQIISTDYYLPSTLFASSYKVIFEDGMYERVR